MNDEKEQTALEQHVNQPPEYARNMAAESALQQAFGNPRPTLEIEKVKGGFILRQVDFHKSSIGFICVAPNLAQVCKRVREFFEPKEDEEEK